MQLKALSQQGYPRIALFTGVVYCAVSIFLHSYHVAVLIPSFLLHCFGCFIICAGCGRMAGETGITYTNSVFLKDWAEKDLTRNSGRKWYVCKYYILRLCLFISYEKIPHS